MLTEAVAEVSVTAETAFIGNLDNTLFRLLDKPAGGTIQTQLKDVAGQFHIFAALGECGTDTFLRQLEAVHDSLTLELGIKEQPLADNDIVEILEQLPAERNRYIRQWEEAGITPRNAAQSQALLQLHNEYCSNHNCLNCQIGYKIITH